MNISDGEAGTELPSYQRQKGERIKEVNPEVRRQNCCRDFAVLLRVSSTTNTTAACLYQFTKQHGVTTRAHNADTVRRNKPQVSQTSLPLHSVSPSHKEGCARFVSRLGHWIYRLAFSCFFPVPLSIWRNSVFQLQCKDHLGNTDRDWWI